MTTEDSGIPAVTAEDHPDAELLRLAREIADASNAGNAAATDEEAEPFLDLATKLRHQLAEMPAHTPDGIIARFDDYRRIHEGGATSVWDKDLLRTIGEGLERIGATASVDPDSTLLDLWREYRQNSKEWGTQDDDAGPYAERAQEIERRIIAAPAEGVLGLAIKLRIAVDNTPEDEEPEFNDQRAMLAVLDDVDRLAGFNEPRRVWRVS